MNGKGEEFDLLISSSWEYVMRSWFDRLSVKRLFRSAVTEFTTLSCAYIELAKAIEYWERRFWVARCPQLLEEPFVGCQPLFRV